MNAGRPHKQGSAALRGVLRHAHPLAGYTVWRVGGPAEQVYQPTDVDDLARFLGTLEEDEPIFWLGLGSNVLVRDGGVRGTVILSNRLAHGPERLDDNRVWVEAGVPCAKMARFCARNGLAGAEFLAGIPGTVGGALAMNAGAFGGETWALVESVQMIHRSGERRDRVPADFEIDYRRVQVPADEWFVAGVFQLQPGDATQIEERIREMLRERARTQPTGKRSCGSVFRNPQPQAAGRLIDACGLKGRRVGDAAVSDKHANFILNLGDARAHDIEVLIDEVQAEVQREHGVSLTPEVRIVGQLDVPEDEGGTDD